MPPGGLNIRWPDDWHTQEYRLQRHKVYAALAFARANRLDRIVIDSPRPRFGIVTTASRISTSARPSTTSASTSGWPPRSASGSTRW
jgi:TPP-dependent indolepyruvate ferredoxin oxidoreductase alpha subunit